MKTVSLVIDGVTHKVRVGDGRNLLDVCLSLGLDLPYFCWHPAMHSVGACRQCAVKVFKDEKDARGRIVMSCMTPVEEGMRVSVEDPQAKSFRKGIVEFLMVNHPHDCPVCDEGGECHLQDMTVMTGHNYRRYRFTKRTHRNQDLGPFVNHEMNRCIQCYRCARFYRDYAGGRDFAVLGCHDHVYFGRHESGTLENQFSGNLCEVCPTGVFTDKTLKSHYVRKWDLHTAPAVCPHCAVGCGITPGERYGSLKRIKPRYNGEVNSYFICDRGRYGYEYANAETRIRGALMKGSGGLEPAQDLLALGEAARALGAGRPMGIGSARASVETNYALRALVGPGDFYLSESDSTVELYGLMALTLAEGGTASASPREASRADAVLVLGEDVWNTAPILALNLRQASRNAPNRAATAKMRISPWDDAALREAAQDRPGPFYLALSEASELDGVARETYRAGPDDIARLGFAVAKAIDPAAPGPQDLAPAVQELAARIAAELKAAERPLVVAGSALGSAALIQAAACVAKALKAAGRSPLISLVFPEANSLGAAMLGPRGLGSAARAMGEGRPLVIAEAELLRSMGPDAAALLERATRVVAIDHTANRTTAFSHIVLPAAALGEGTGTFVSSEGRAQRFFPAFKPESPIADSWRWIGRLAGASGKPAQAWSSLEEIQKAIAAEFPALAGIQKAAPGADWRFEGQRIGRGSHRESGRTSVNAHRDVHEAMPPADQDSGLAYTMEGSPRDQPSALVPRFWSPGWNSDQAVNKFQSEVNGELYGGDPGERLFEPSEVQGGYEAGAIPAAFAARKDALLALPRFLSFGSDELSSLAPAVKQRIPAPHVGVSKADAGRLGLFDGERARLSFLDGRPPVVLPVKIRDLAPGTASLPVGLPGSPLLREPAWVKLEALL